MNVNRKNFFCSQGLNNSTFFEPHILTALHFDWHRTGLLESYWFKVTYGGWEITCDCVEQILSSFHYSNKKYGRGGKTFQPVLIFMYIIMPSFTQLQLCINTVFICRSIHFGRDNLEVGMFLKQASPAWIWSITAWTSLLCKISFKISKLYNVTFYSKFVSSTDILLPAIWLSLFLFFVKGTIVLWNYWMV